MKALLLVDLHNEFLPFGMQPKAGIVDLIAQINGAMENYDRIIATQLWFPATHQRFAANHPWRHPGGAIEIDGVVQSLYEYQCVQDTFGAALISTLDQSRIERIFQRGTHPSHDIESVFFDKKEHPTGLLAFLKAEQIEEITLAGVNIAETFEKTKAEASCLSIHVSTCSRSI